MNKQKIGRDADGNFVYVDPTSRNSNVQCCGGSGVGKTTLAVEMIISAAEAGKQIIVLNWHNTANKEIMLPEQKKRYLKYVNVIDVAREGIKLPLFQKMKLSDGSTETELVMLQRITSVFKIAADLTAPQERMLASAVKDVYKKGLYREEGVKVVYDWLETQKKNVALNAASKIAPLCEGNLIRHGDFLEEKHKIIELDLNGLEYDVQDLMVRFILDYLLRIAQKGCFLNKPLTVYIDEAQNLEYKHNGTMYTLLNEGRKLKLNVLLTYPSLFTGAKSGMDVITQCATGLYFKPLIKDLEKVAELIDNGKDVSSWTFSLSRLKCGECIASGIFEINGQVRTKPLLIKAL